jgi:hypothetical protein
MHPQEGSAWKQIGIGFACVFMAVILAYWVTPWLFVLALPGVLLIVGGWTDTPLYPGHPDNAKARNI